MMNKRLAEMKVSLDDLPTPASLRQIWVALEARAELSFFQSWLWIGTWLESLPAHIKPLLLKIERDGVTIGLGILSNRTVVRHGILRSRALFLNDTGDPALDEITIEHNGLLSERGNSAVVAQACMNFLLRDYHGWDELFLDGMCQPEVIEAVHLDHARLRTLSRRACHYVDLNGLRQAGGDYLSRLGKNTRYTIRRSMRAYEKLGALQLTEAETAAQAREYLDRLRHFHQQYWQQKGMPGSFANTFFSDFHARLVAKGAGEAAIQMLRVTVGEHEIGYLYNFVHRGRVYNYQTGFDYGLGGTHSRPGLVCHALAVQHNVRLGHRMYDFMAGDSDYKKNLGTGSEAMAWEVIQRPRPKFHIENALRIIRDRLRSKTPLPDDNVQPNTIKSTGEGAS